MTRRLQRITKAKMESMYVGRPVYGIIVKCDLFFDSFEHYFVEWQVKALLMCINTSSTGATQAFSLVRGNCGIQ